MTPETLGAYLKVLKDAGLMQGAISIEGLTLNFAFEPERPDGYGATPTPGGWKGPSNLDAPFEEIP